VEPRPAHLTLSPGVYVTKATSPRAAIRPVRTHAYRPTSSFESALPTSCQCRGRHSPIMSAEREANDVGGGKPDGMWQELFYSGGSVQSATLSATRGKLQF